MNILITKKRRLRLLLRDYAVLLPRSTKSSLTLNILKRLPTPVTPTPESPIRPARRQSFTDQLMCNLMLPKTIKELVSVMVN